MSDTTSTTDPRARLLAAAVEGLRAEGMRSVTAENAVEEFPASLERWLEKYMAGDDGEEAARRALLAETAKAMGWV